MAMRKFELQYSIGPCGESAHITKMSNELYRMFHTDYTCVIRRRDLTTKQYSEFMDELYNRYTQPAHDYDSIEAFRNYIAFERFDVDSDDWSLFHNEDAMRNA